jgi:hypothetical protein
LVALQKILKSQADNREYYDIPPSGCWAAHRRRRRHRRLPLPSTRRLRIHCVAPVTMGSNMAWSKSTRIKVMIAIDTAFFLLELICGFLAHSLALTADAFHMVRILSLPSATGVSTLTSLLIFATAQRHHLSRHRVMGCCRGSKSNHRRVHIWSTYYSLPPDANSPSLLTKTRF